MAVLGLVCAVLAGCGGGGSSAQEKQFVAQANAICAQELAVLSRTPEPTTPAQAISYLPKAIAIIQRQSGRLEALPVPASKRRDLEAALSTGRQLEQRPGKASERQALVTQRVSPALRKWTLICSLNVTLCDCTCENVASW